MDIFSSDEDDDDDDDEGIDGLAEFRVSPTAALQKDPEQDDDAEVLEVSAPERPPAEVVERMEDYEEQATPQDKPAQVTVSAPIKKEKQQIKASRKRSKPGGVPPGSPAAIAPEVRRTNSAPVATAGASAPGLRPQPIQRSHSVSSAASGSKGSKKPAGKTSCVFANTVACFDRASFMGKQKRFLEEMVRSGGGQVTSSPGSATHKLGFGGHIFSSPGGAT